MFRFSPIDRLIIFNVSWLCMAWRCRGLDMEIKCTPLRYAGMLLLSHVHNITCHRNTIKSINPNSIRFSPFNQFLLKQSFMCSIRFLAKILHIYTSNMWHNIWKMMTCCRYVLACRTQIWLVFMFYFRYESHMFIVSTSFLSWMATLDIPRVRGRIFIQFLWLLLWVHKYIIYIYMLYRKSAITMRCWSWCTCACNVCVNSALLFPDCVPYVRRWVSFQFTAQM